MINKRTMPTIDPNSQPFNQYIIYGPIARVYTPDPTGFIISKEDIDLLYKYRFRTAKSGQVYALHNRKRIPIELLISNTPYINGPRRFRHTNGKLWDCTRPNINEVVRSREYDKHQMNLKRKNTTSSTPLDKSPKQ